MFSTYTPLAVYPADGVQIDFAAPDLFYDVADIQAVVVIDGVETPVTAGVDFNVVVIGRETTPPFRQTGLLRFVVPPADGANVVPFILPALVQDQRFEGRPVSPREHERVHDRHTQTSAMLFELFNRGYRSPLDTPPALRFIVAGRTGYVPTWDEDGNLIEGPTVQDVNIVAGFIDDVVTVAGIETQVVALGARAAEIDALYAIRTDIDALGAIVPAIVSAAGIDTEIVAVAAHTSEIDSVAANMAAILAAEGHASDAEAAATAAQAAEAAVALSALPVGSIKMRFVDLDPGHLPFGEGGTFDVETYPDLAAWMAVNFPALGPGELPDWRDYSPRTAGGSLGPAVGDTQEDAMQGHIHENSATSFVFQTGSGGGRPAPDNSGPVKSNTSEPLNDGTNGEPRTANETRVKSFGVRWQIKAYGAFVNQGTADLVAIEQGYQTMLNGAVRGDVDQTGKDESWKEQARANIGGSLGHDQTWQDVTASSAINTIYQNTTGRPIMWKARAGNNTLPQMQISLDGVTFTRVVEFGGVNNPNQAWADLVVPPGQYYRNTNNAVTEWWELR